MPSWWRELHSWFKPETQTPCALDHAGFEELCRERPAVARAALAADQQELMVEFEKLYEAYERRLNELGLRVRGLSPEAEAEELAEVRAAQDAFRVIIRRIEASSRAARELQRELYEWEQREGEEGARHADHPRVRAEIARSELEARGISTRRRNLEQDAAATAHVPSIVSKPPEEAVPVGREATFHVPELEEAAQEEVSPEELLETIKMLTREVERWQGHREVDPEVVDDLRELRALHAELKRQDRAARLNRDRLKLAVSLR